MGITAEVYHKEGGEYSLYHWANTPVVEKSFYDVSITVGRGLVVKDRAKITLPFGVSTFNYDDYVRLIWTQGKRYEDMSEEERTENVIFAGNVDRISVSTGALKTRTVELSSFAEFLFRTPINLDLSDKTTPEIIQEALAQYNSINQGRKVYWASTNPETKQDGSAFPTHDTYVCVNKPMLEILEEVSGSRYTEDGQYKYYVKEIDKTFYLFWTPLLNLGEYNPKEYISRTIGYNPSNAASQLIYSLGDDLEGNPVSDTYLDIDMASRIGVKVKYINEFNHTIDEVVVTEKIKNPSSFGTGKYPSSYPYTFVISGNTVGGDEEFNQEVVRIAKEVGRELAKQWIFRQKVGLREEIVYPLSTNIDLEVGAKVYRSYPEIGQENVRMYVERVVYSRRGKKVVLAEFEEGVW